MEYGTAWVTTYGNTATVISNNGLAAVNAVNDLLARGVTVGFITEAGDHYSKGDFVIDHKDVGQIDDQYVIEITHVADMPKAKVITEPKVYVDDDHFDRFAFSRQMNFKTTSDVSEANVVFSSNEPEEDVQAAVKAGLPFVGASANILEYAKATIPGFDFDIQWIIEEECTAPRRSITTTRPCSTWSMPTASSCQLCRRRRLYHPPRAAPSFPLTRREATVLMRASSGMTSTRPAGGTASTIPRRA